MLISPVQNYKQNFTALRLKSGSKRFLTSMPPKALSYVDRAGEHIKNTTFYNIDISDNITISHINGDKFYLPISIQNAGKTLILRAKQGYQQISKKIIFDNETKANEAFKSISQSETPLLRAAKIVKYLDDYEIKLAKLRDKIEDILPTDAHEDIVRKLIQKYGV